MYYTYIDAVTFWQLMYTTVHYKNVKEQHEYSSHEF